MKPNARILFLLGVMLTFGLGLSAQKTMLIRDVQPLLAHASTTLYDVELSAEAYSNSYRFYLEEKIQLKDWMVDLHGWEAQKEETVPVADWMIQPFGVDRRGLTELIRVEREEPILLEDWMICCADWKITRL